jgi:hypothetical protein
LGTGRFGASRLAKFAGRQPKPKKRPTKQKGPFFRDGKGGDGQEDSNRGVDFWGKRGEMGFAVVERKLGENRKIRSLSRAEEIATAEPKQGGLLMGKCSGEKVILLGEPVWHGNCV